MTGRELYDEWCSCIYLRCGDMPREWVHLTHEQRAAWNDLAEKVRK